MNAMEGLADTGEPAAGSAWCLFDLVGGGVAVTTPDGTLEFCNTALLRQLSQDAEALLGTSIFKLLDGGAPGGLETLHRAPMTANGELRTQVRSSSGRFVASVVVRRLDRIDGQRRV